MTVKYILESQFKKMAANGQTFTKTQQRIVDILSDGLPHHRDELLECLRDREATHRNVSVHLVHIRRVLRPNGQDILCELVHRRICYRHVRMIHSTAQG